jgi:hypothetical protein
MVTVFGAPIGPTDTKIIVDYLVTNYRHRQLNAFDAKRVDVQLALTRRACTRNNVAASVLRYRP